MSHWQPIETAPSDGTEILLWVPSNLSVGERGYIHLASAITWDGRVEWEDTHSVMVEGATLWHPLPSQPADRQAQEAAVGIG